MFEKEAESYATRECCMTCNNINHFCKEKCECWTFAKKGVLFGYNKANKRYAELEKENRVLKCFIKDLIYENHNMCFQFSNTTCLFNSDYRNRAEELIGEKL